ncbi:MAG: hypothetical protein ACJ79A_19635, partial [Gemmatimonadaceae bacterium]
MAYLVGNGHRRNQRVRQQKTKELVPERPQLLFKFPGSLAAERKACVLCSSSVLIAGSRRFAGLWSIPSIAE